MGQSQDYSSQGHKFATSLRHLFSFHGKTKFCRHKHSCLRNSLFSFFRSFVIGYGLKCTFSLVIGVLFRKLYKRPELWKETIISKDSFQLGLFLGTYTSSLKFIQCLLRIIRKKDDGWNAIIAGGLAGFSLLLDSEDRHIDIGVYTLARAMHAFSIYLSEKNILPKFIREFEHGYLIIFCISCSILIAVFVYEPWNLSPSYYKLFHKMEQYCGFADVADIWRMQFRKQLFAPVGIPTTTTKTTTEVTSLLSSTSQEKSSNYSPSEMPSDDLSHSDTTSPTVSTITTTTRSKSTNTPTTLTPVPSGTPIEIFSDCDKCHNQQNDNISCDVNANIHLKEMTSNGNEEINIK